MCVYFSVGNYCLAYSSIFSFRFGIAFAARKKKKKEKKKKGGGGGGKKVIKNKMKKKGCQRFETKIKAKI